MNHQDADQLIAKYLDNTATPEERALVENWYIFESDKRKLSDDDKFDHLAAELWAGTRQRAGLQTQPKVRSLWPRIAVAASIVFILSVGLFVLLKHNGTGQPGDNDQNRIGAITERFPTLILTDGKEVTLHKSKNEQLISQSPGLVTRLTNGVLDYQQGSENQDDNKVIAYNSLLVPSGAHYQVVVLPDGTKVWINAASSLRYPTAFNGGERRVELKGEAYFEVAHNAAKPFRVASNNQTVEVLGTHFNISAYDDDPAVKTTLLEGKVKVTGTANKATRFLLPGQQAVLGKNAFIVSKAETTEAVAWKNDQFDFQDDNIQHIMRVIARWYDMKVTYEGPIPEDKFGGTINRNANVSESLNILELTGKVRFHVKGRQIVVSK
ncbi:FecR family protein [Mucilaginibacter endophyticus]|uniref:FecR family protein n=1 Tax=Mucilaginibacter endophyticus TaxID=2675003 RepID=UPI000E0D280F|nr:FecR family protein [Mucilaginibacter endophyticus]